METITEALANGESAQMFGLGTFEKHQRTTRKGRNPQTGKKIKIPAVTASAFKSGKLLKKLENKCDLPVISKVFHNV